MYIFLIIWFLFLFAYIIFNVYGIYRVLAMRLKGDAVPLAVLLYLLTIFIIIAATIIFAANLDWGKPLGELIKL